MSNLRLKDHTWDAANVYDSALGKTQEQINAEVGTSLAGKQGTLVSGENIKTVNGASILGSGNIEIQGGGGSSVTVDDELSEISENPVQNKVITGAVNLGIKRIVRIMPRWEQGSIGLSTGSNKSADYDIHCRTPWELIMTFPECLGNLITVSGPAGFEIAWVRYKRTPSSNQYMGYGTWTPMPTSIQIVPGDRYRFLLRKPNGDGTYAEISRGVDFTDNEILFEYATADSSQNIISRNDPIEMGEKLQQLTRKTKISDDNFGLKPLCFIHFSDVHGDANALSNVIAFADHYSAFVDEIIHTGDSVAATIASKMSFWDRTSGSGRILNVIGNHDTKRNSNWTEVSMSECYDYYFAPYIENWNVVCETGKTYYYKDYSSEKVRMIVLDIMHQTEDQLTWFASTLASALSGGLHVVCFVHSRASWKIYPFDTVWDDGAQLTSYPSSFSDTSGYAGTNYPSNLAQGYVDAVDDFINGGGNFVAWFHGHTHYKMFATISDHQNQLDVAVGNAACSSIFANSTVAREEYTKTMDNFNVVAIDTTSKLLKICKVGVSYDRLMRKCDTICWDYGNSTLMYPHDTHGIEITEQPADFSGAVGDTATFSVTASGDGLRYQWQYKRPSDEGFSDSALATADEAEFKIGVTSARNGIAFRCAITNGHGHRIVSDAATLTITS